VANEPIERDGFVTCLPSCWRSRRPKSDHFHQRGLGPTLAWERHPHVICFTCERHCRQNHVWRTQKTPNMGTKWELVVNPQSIIGMRQSIHGRSTPRAGQMDSKMVDWGPFLYSIFSVAQNPRNQLFHVAQPGHGQHPTTNRTPLPRQPHLEATLNSH
jgi:hypothetical protein